MMDISALRSALAKGVATYLLNAADYPHAKLVGAKSHDGFDLLEIMLEPQLSQKRVVRILDQEPIEIFFSHGDAVPHVWATRADFPIDAVHTTAATGVLRSVALCVWEESWPDLKRQLTPQALVERLRSWFSRLAEGSLHQVGQPLEPLIPAASHTLIVPGGECPERLEIAGSFKRDGQMFLSLGPAGLTKEKPADLDLLEIRVRQPQTHGALGSTPDNVAELTTRLTKMGEDLQPRLSDWARAGAIGTSAKSIPLIVVSVPKVAEEGDEAEEWEYWAFTTRGTITDLADDLGQIYVEPNGSIFQRIPGATVDSNEIKLDPMRLVKRLTRAEARRMSGFQGPETRLVAIGAGAIGSNVIVDSAHTGFATWTVIDNDVALPHNTVRQHLGNDGVGHPKAAVTSAEVNFLLQEPSAKFIVADLLDEGDKAKAIADSLSAADLTIDFSASPAVLGNLADRAEPRRLASMFFNPAGDQLVALAEDEKRYARLDEIEAQYYWAVAVSPELSSHFDDGRLGFLRYANACQDLSRPLPPWQIQALSAIGAKRLLDLTSDKSASARIWRLDPDSGSIQAFQLPVSQSRRFDGGEFRISFSELAVGSMTRLREQGLPNETGGILIGSFDTSRQIVHVVDVLAAPPDSEQRPTYFVRGKKDLLPAVEGIAARTVNNLQYLGEWHSHPRGASTMPSGDDRNVFAYLARHLAPTGQPFGMTICGQKDFRILFGWNEMRFEGTSSLLASTVP